MFGHRYFGGRHFGCRYFGDCGAEAPAGGSAVPCTIAISLSIQL